MSAHTPGLWITDPKAREYSRTVEIFGPEDQYKDRYRVAVAEPAGGSWEVAHANARLIAAAPELLLRLTEAGARERKLLDLLRYAFDYPLAMERNSEFIAKVSAALATTTTI